jgi:hypothetical protein
MRPKKIDIDLIDRAGRTVRLDGSDLDLFFSAANGKQNGQKFSFRKAQQNWVEHEHFEIQDIEQGDPFTCLLVWRGITYEATLTFRLNNDSTLDHIVGWGMGRPEQAYFVRAEGPKVANPPKGHLTHREFHEWISGLKVGGYQVEITDIAGQRVELTAP